MASPPSSNVGGNTWQPPAPEELQELLPQYEITGMLGRGGMGAVYRGRQISLDRAVAVKILSNALEEADASFVERFKNEARSMAKLMHPGIVAVFDFGETPDGLLYIVMEFIEGTDVARMLAEQKRLHTEHAVAITAHVLDALAYAHERGIIHRDIKPANVMVGYDGVVKVADFGLAKMGGGDATAGLTQSGMAMGTLHFMAPEALTLGSAVDQRADIYAVGVMLYQMLTGRLPQGMFELPSLQVPGLDPRLDSIITKALRDDRELRYSCASEMRQDLDSARTQPIVQVKSDAHEAPAALPTEVRPRKSAGPPDRTPQAPFRVPRPAPRSGALWLVAALLAGAAAASWLYLGMSRNKPEAQSAIATKEQPFENGLGMKFVPVPITGGPSGGQRVLFSIWETRVKDYEAFMRTQPDREWLAPTFHQESDHPAVRMQWPDTVDFCDWLTAEDRKEGLIGDDEHYRLPTDHEWSCALGIGPQEDPSQLPEAKDRIFPELYPWGSSWPPPPGAGNLYGEETIEDPEPEPSGRPKPPIKGYEDPFVRTGPVGSFSANQFGLYDMVGSVSEWCSDWYSGEQARRVLRGSSWVNNVSLFQLSSNRNFLTPGIRFESNGFRVVLAKDTTLSQ
jgi:predicted Ser/Thr protein kinase